MTQLQQTELDKLLANYADIFSDTPGKTFLANHHPPHLNGPKRQFLNRMSPNNPKLLRWNLELQEYNLQIINRSGRNNLLPDILSRPSV